MSHRHWCDVTGHEWECQGAALRPLRGDTEPTPCYCINHQTLMEDGDHCQCSIELIACEEHRDQQLRAMGYEPGQAIEPPTQGPEESSMFKDEDGNPTVGFCLWCSKDFYSMDEVEAHNADNMAACEVSQALKDEHCMPPVLQMMFKNAGFLNDEDTDDKPVHTVRKQ
jgi:hypothetical protein